MVWGLLFNLRDHPFEPSRNELLKGFFDFLTNFDLCDFSSHNLVAAVLQFCASNSHSHKTMAVCRGLCVYKYRSGKKKRETKNYLGTGFLSPAVKRQQGYFYSLRRYFLCVSVCPTKLGSTDINNEL